MVWIVAGKIFVLGLLLEQQQGLWPFVMVARFAVANGEGDKIQESHLNSTIMQFRGNCKIIQEEQQQQQQHSCKSKASVSVKSHSVVMHAIQLKLFSTSYSLLTNSYPFQRVRGNASIIVYYLIALRRN